MTRHPGSEFPAPQELPRSAIALSPGQQRLWFLHRLHGGSEEYHIPEAYRLRGPLDVAALARAVNSLVARHEILRTGYRLVGDRPVAVPTPQGSVRIPLAAEDLTHLAAPAREQFVAEALRDEWRRPFDLDHGPILRARLIRIAEDEHVFIMTTHHIGSDGWSQAILRRELTALYTGLRAERPDVLPAPVVQYSDYARWQAERTEAGMTEESVGYWRDRLAGCPELTELPTDWPRRARAAAPGGVYRVRLDDTLVTALHQSCVSSGTTLYMSLLAAFSVLISRYSAQDDVAIGTPVANRMRTEWEQVVGFFVNTLVMRMAVRPDMTMGEVLQEVKRTALSAYQHQEAPFERIVQSLATRRLLSRTPVFQVMFALQTVSAEPLRLADLAAEPLEFPEVKARFDLELHVLTGPERTDLHWVYDDTLFARDRIERMAADFIRLLNELLLHPEYAVTHLPLDLPAGPSPLAPGESEAPTAETRAPEQYEVIRQLFAEVLGLADVGVDDDFFVLGGHSLMVLSLIAKVETSYGVSLEVRDVFEAPTAARLTERIFAAAPPAPSAAAH